MGELMNFEHDLSEICKEMMRNAGIEISGEWSDSYTCIKYLELHQRWFNSSIPYGVVCSKELLKKIPQLSTDEQAALQDIIYRLKNCITITPYMSKGIKNTAVKKSDFFLKNWGIYHLHLEKAMLIKKFTKPNLLFFQPQGQIVHLIDIREHPTGAGWFIRDLLEIVYDNWPWLLHYFPEYRPTYSIKDSDVHNALKSILVAIPFRNGLLMPTTLGVASSGDSNMAVREAYRVLNQLHKWEIELKENEEDIREKIFDSMSIQITESLDYELIIEDGFFVAYEKHSNAKIKLFQAE